MKNFSSIRLKTVIIIIIIIIFYVGLTLFSDFSKISANYLKINLIFLIPIFSLVLFNMFLGSLRQNLFLKSMEIKLGIKRNFFLYVAGLSMMITPLGSGQMIKSIFMESKYGYAIHKTAPLVISERFCDLLATCLVISTTLLFYYSIVSMTLVLFFLGLLSVIVLILKNSHFTKIMLKILQRIPLFSKISSQFEEFDESLKYIFKFKLICKAVCFSTLIIFIEAVIVNMGFLTFGIKIDYFESTQFFYTSLLAGTLSFIPGGVGATEGSFIGLLVQRHYDLGLATALILFIRFTTIWFSTLSGSVVSYFITRKNSSTEASCY